MINIMPAELNPLCMTLKDVVAKRRSQILISHGFINKACQKPKDFGYSAELWYPVSFTSFINGVSEQEGHPRMTTVTETTLRKILANAKIRPFKVSYLLRKARSGF